MYRDAGENRDDTKEALWRSIGHDLFFGTFTGADVEAESKWAAVDETISLGGRTREVLLNDLAHSNGAPRESSRSTRFAKEMEVCLARNFCVAGGSRV